MDAITCDHCNTVFEATNGSCPHCGCIIGSGQSIHMESVNSYHQWLIDQLVHEQRQIDKMHQLKRKGWAKADERLRAAMVMYSCFSQAKRRYEQFLKGEL